MTLRASASKLLAILAVGAPVFALAAVGQAHTSPAQDKANQYAARATESSSQPVTKNGKPATDPKIVGTSGLPSATDTKTNVQLGDVYRIGVEDELQISVWREPELSLPVVVRPDGMITLPLLNDLSVVGQTTDELRAMLTEKLKAFVNDPQVTITVRQIRSRKVFLVGQVSRQGAYQLNGRKTILELLTEAGGLGLFAKSRSIYVLRMVNGKEQKIPFNYKRVVSGHGNEGKDDILLLPGDIVVVP
jgi:polysaccharide biosynthesis/export protein